MVVWVLKEVQSVDGSRRHLVSGKETEAPRRGGEAACPRLPQSPVLLLEPECRSRLQPHPHSIPFLMGARGPPVGRAREWLRSFRSPSPLSRKLLHLVEGSSVLSGRQPSLTGVSALYLG